MQKKCSTQTTQNWPLCLDIFIPSNPNMADRLGYYHWNKKGNIIHCCYKKLYILKSSILSAKQKKKLLQLCAMSLSKPSWLAAAATWN